MTKILLKNCFYIQTAANAEGLYSNDILINENLIVKIGEKI